MLTVVFLSSMPLVIMLCVDISKPPSGYDDEFKDIINN
jgi:hypothetical protein